MIQFTILEEDNIPISVKEWVEQNKERESNIIIDDNDKSYIAIIRGEKRTGGYSISIKDIEEQDESILVKVEYLDPDPEKMVMQIITYPFLVIELEKIEKKSMIEIVMQIPKLQNK